MVKKQHFSRNGRHSIELIERLGRALHRYGLPSHRTELALQSVCGPLGVSGEFFATPTAIFASLSDGDERSTLLLRVEPGEVQLAKLGELDRLVEEISSQERDIASAIAELRRITASSSPHGWRALLAAHSLAAASAGLFLGGGWRELFGAALIGLITGCWVILIPRLNRRVLGLESLAAFSAGLIAVAIAAHFGPLSVYITTLAGLIVLFPGLTLTVSINELATRNLAAGTVRMSAAALTFIQLGFGLAIGVRIGETLFGAQPTFEPLPLSGGWVVLSLMLTTLAFVLLFQAELRSYGWTALAAAIAYLVTRVVAMHGGAEAGAFAGALALGVASHLYARLLRRPAAQMLIPGVMLIVPGSLGVRSVSTLIGHDVVGGIQIALTVALVAVSLVSGLLAAGALVPLRRNF